MALDMQHFWDVFNTASNQGPKPGLDLDQHFSVQNLGPRCHQPKITFPFLPGHRGRPTQLTISPMATASEGWASPTRGSSRVFLGSAEDFIHSFGFSHFDVQVAGWSQSCDDFGW